MPCGGRCARRASARPLRIGRRRACRTICRPASTSRRSKPDLARSKASAPPSPPLSVWPRAGPTNAPTLITNWSPVRRRPLATSWRARTWRTPCTATSSTAAAPCYVVRIGGDCAHARRRGPSSPTAKDGQPRLPRLALESGPGGNQITVEVTEATDAADDTFKLTVSAPARTSETYDNVTTKRGKTQRRDAGQGAVEAHPARGDRHRRRARAHPRDAARSRLAGADGAKPMRLRARGLRRRLRPTGPASPASRRSTTSPCSPCPT